MFDLLFVSNIFSLMDAETDGVTDRNDEEEEERSVRLSVLNTGLVLLTIPAVVFLLMELGIIPMFF